MELAFSSGLQILEHVMAEVDEAEILQAGRAGRVLDCAGGGGRRRVDADLVRHCCRELKDQIDPRGLRFRGASVTGCLDLAGMEVPFPLSFHQCEFDSANPGPVVSRLPARPGHHLAGSPCRSVSHEGHHASRDRIHHPRPPLRQRHS